MTKQKREKLREGDIYELAKLLPADLFWGMPFYPCDLKEIIAPFLDHIDALEGIVEAAFKEGYSEGCSAGSSRIHNIEADKNDCWNISDAKAAIASAPEVSGG